MRKSLNIKNENGIFLYYLDNKEITVDELVRIGCLQCREGFNYEIVEVKDVMVRFNSGDRQISKRIYVGTPFGTTEIKPNHDFYVECAETAPTLESVAEYWRGYFMEEDDSVNMTMAEHKRFAEECAEAGITALDVYKYLGV